MWAVLNRNHPGPCPQFIAKFAMGDRITVVVTSHDEVKVVTSILIIVNSLLERSLRISNCVLQKAPVMDKLESLSSTIQNITLYDIKSMYNQVSEACSGSNCADAMVVRRRMSS